MPRVRLRKLFTNDEIMSAIEEADNFGQAARVLSNLRGVGVA